MTTTLDPSLSVRGKIIAALKSDAQLIAVVPAARIYPARAPSPLAWPFIRVPLLLGVAAELDGGSGSDQSGIVHCFTKTSPPAVLDGEAQAAIINAHIARILSEIDDVELADGQSVGVMVTQTQTIGDPDEADGWHGLVSVQAYAT